MTAVVDYQKNNVHPIMEALEEIRSGRMIIVTDDEGRENEGDLVIPAEKATPQVINFMATHGRGLICVALTAERIDQLKIPMMVPQNMVTDPFRTAFTVSVDAKKGTSTGISAYDRAKTIGTLLNVDSTLDDFVMPGHIFPLRAHPQGILSRPGHTEAAIEFAQLAGFSSAGVICEIMADDGTMARMPQLEVFASVHGLKIFTIASLIDYCKERE